ncbi:MAG TPA: response regulator transcription factor [Thermoleophilaceae bacterium]
MSERRRTILVVEDERSIAEPLAAALDREGFATAIAGTVAEALEMAKQVEPDLVLLDLMLPDGSGYEVTRELRSGSSVPIVMLTARGDESDRILGLELGADDYIVKPFSAREVAARIRAVLRRAEAAPERKGAAPEPSDEAIEIGGVRLDPAKRVVTRDGEEVDLARKEYELLQHLMENAGRVVTRDRLLEEVWDMNWFGSTKTLDVHVSAVRKKLGDDPSDPRYLHTVRGVGFRFAGRDELG